MVTGGHGWSRGGWLNRSEIRGSRVVTGGHGWSRGVWLSSSEIRDLRVVSVTDEWSRVVTVGNESSRGGCENTGGNGRSRVVTGLPAPKSVQTLWKIVWLR